MDIYWYGQSCFKLKGKNVTILVDPYKPEYVGLKLPKDLSADTVLLTHAHEDHNFSQATTSINGGKPMVFERPGEYEVGGVVISGVNSYHDNSGGSERGTNTIFHLLFDNLDIVHLGDLGQNKLTEEQIVEIGQVDILLIPVGSIHTIDAKAASDIVVQLEPKIIIPMHYKIEGLKIELDGVENFLKEMGAERVVPVPKLSITKEKLPEEPQVVVLSKN